MNKMFTNKNNIHSFDFEADSSETISKLVSNKLDFLTESQITPDEYESLAYSIILFGCEMIDSIPKRVSDSSSSNKQIEELKERIYAVKNTDAYRAKYPTHINMMKKHIDNNFHTTIKITDLAEIAGLSPNYAGKLFHKYIGMSVPNYVNMLRIKKSCYLLANTNLKIYEIAQQVGYSESYYFSYIFKKIMKISPIDYRKEPSKR